MILKPGGGGAFFNASTREEEVGESVWVWNHQKKKKKKSNFDGVFKFPHVSMWPQPHRLTKRVYDYI